MDTISSHSKEHALVFRLRQPACGWSFAVLLAGFYVVTNLYISSRRLLWFDEIYTAITCRMPDVHTILKSLAESQQQIPPLYFLIARVFDQAFSHADFGMRVPSAFAFGAGMLVTFDIARRLTDGLYGLIAMSLLTTSFVTYYGYEARPYAIYFMLAAMGLWLWVATKDENKAAAIAFGALVFVGVSVHYYFVLCVVPFGIMALAEKRIFHPKAVAAAVGVSLSLAVSYVQIAKTLAAASTGAIGTWGLPSVSLLQGIYVEIILRAILPLVLIAVGVVVFGVPRDRTVPAMSPSERVCWLFLMVPLAEYVLAHMLHGFMHNRYIIGAVPGVVVAVTCSFWRHCRESGFISLAVLVMVGGFGLSQHLRTLMRIDHIQATGAGDYQQQTRDMLAMGETLQREGKRHIAVTDAVLYLEVWYYSKHPENYSLISPVWDFKRYAALSFLSVKDIVANARETAIVGPEPALIQMLERAGLHSRVRFIEPQYVVYLE